MYSRNKTRRTRKALIWVIALILAICTLLSTLYFTGVLKNAADTVMHAFAPASSKSTKSDLPPDSVGIIDPSSPPPLENTNNSSSGENTADPSAQVPFSRPEHIRGTWVYPFKDFLTSQSPTVKDAVSQWETVLKGISEYKFNTIILPVISDGKSLFPKAEGSQYALGDSQEDLLSALIKKAHDAGKYVFALLPLMQDASMDVLSVRTLGNVKALAKYEIDGLIIDNYHQSANNATYAQYTKSGGGIGLEAFIRLQMTALIKNTSRTVRSVNKKIYFGITAHPVWALKAQSTEGIDASSDFTAYHNGFSDTLGWVKSGLLDTVIVKNDLPTGQGALSFEKVTSWWSEKTKAAATELIIAHASEKVQKKASGFGVDQLTKQMIALENYKLAGSVFDSYSALKSDSSGSTAALLGYLDGKISSSNILKELGVTSPTKTTFTTNESSFVVRGASDPTFPLTFDGKPVERSDMGYFSVTLNLKPGKNTFKFTHKDKTITYSVTYNRIIIKDFFPAANQTVRGGTSLTVTALALKDSTVTASLFGTSIKMSPTTTSGETDGNAANNNSASFETYTGVFQIPAAKSKDQDLGKISFKVSNSGQSETRTGGRITVKADGTAVSPGGGEYANVSGKYAAEIIIDHAETFEGKTTDDWSRPVNSYLPKGTVDYVDETEITGPGGKYRLWRFGKRTYVSSKSTGTNIKVYKASLPETNTITVEKVSADTRHTTMVLDTKWKAPFQIVPENTGIFTNPSTTKEPNYGLKSNFNAKYLDITFHYAALGQGVAEFAADNPVFSSAQWFKNERDYTLRLHFKNAGAFYGWGAEYNSEGKLVLKFLHPAKITNSAKPLSNTKIVVDPGHGGSDPGAMGNISGKHESYIALNISNKLKDKLSALGATVVMTRTGDTSLDMRYRTAKTREVMPDLFVSVHLNSNPNKSAKGYENYYFAPFSKKLADAIFSTTSPHFQARSVKYYPFFVTRITECPSILTENGFVSNNEEYSHMLNGSGSEKAAQGTADGIVKYIKSLQ